jgi:hypothetical protein
MKARQIVSTLGLLAMLLSLINPLTPAFTPQLALAEHTPDPASVTIVGSLQSELGCSWRLGPQLRSHIPPVR